MTPMASYSAITVSLLVARAAAASGPMVIPLISGRLDLGVARVRLWFGSGVFHPRV